MARETEVFNLLHERNYRFIIVAGNVTKNNKKFDEISKKIFSFFQTTNSELSKSIGA